jgi:two-component system response regulator GlrR
MGGTEMSETGVQVSGATVDGAGRAERASGRRRGDRIVGSSRAIQDVVERAIAAAQSDQPVEIRGSAGSGKSHVARAIHAWGPRANGPLIQVSCGAVPEAQLARELFGGASAGNSKSADAIEGAFARAARGTLVIESIDRAPAALQASLARAIAEGRYAREGESATRPIEARVIFTALDSRASVLLAGVPHHSIALPPLSERKEDVLPLAAHFLRLAADEEGVTPIGFTAEARNALIAEEWTGNVRELQERVREALRLGGGGAISAEALLLAADLEEIPSFKDAKRAFETRYVQGLLRRCHGNISRAARLAKKDRKDFYDVIRRTGIDPTDFR